jgi:hypothetical protein
MRRMKKMPPITLISTMAARIDAMSSRQGRYACDEQALKIRVFGPYSLRSIVLRVVFADAQEQTGDRLLESVC